MKTYQFPLKLIALIGLIVPRRLRVDWRQEWESELQYRETMLADWDKLNWQTKLDLLRRSIGAFSDAMLLQPRRLEDEMWQDLRFGLRLLKQQRIFASVTILTLALGIGATTTLFSVLDAVLFRALPFAKPEQLVQVENAGQLYHLFPDSTGEFMKAKLPVDLFTHVAAHEIGSVNVTDEQTPERIAAMRVTEGFFPLLGISPQIGRVFAESEKMAKQTRVAVLSHRLWQSRFGGDVNVLNKTVHLNGHSFTVIGVMPRTFRFTQFQQQAEIWVPLVPEENIFASETIFYNVSGRLQDGVTFTQAQVQMDAIFDRLWHLNPNNKPEAKIHSRIRLDTYRNKFSGDLRQPLLILLGAVGCVLLLACVNAANLLLARAAARQKEVAIRATLGASRLRLMRQWLTESTLLALLGGTLGVALAWYAIKVLMTLNLLETTTLHDIEINRRVLGFAFVVALLTGWLYGMVPAWQAAKPDLNHSLKEGGQRSRVLSSRLRFGLTVTEVALSLLLLVGAGLLIKSFQRVMANPLGFNPQNVLTLELTPPRTKYSNKAARAQFYQHIQERMQALPGIETVGITNHLPIVSGGFMIVPLEVVGRPATPENFASAAYRVVSADYFRTLQIPLRAGRPFGVQDTSESSPVIILNQLLSKRMFGDSNPIGQRIILFRDAKTIYEIVGVVGETKTRNLEFMQDAEFYLPTTQRPPLNARLALRTATDPLQITSAVRQAIWEIDKEQPVHNVKTMEQHIKESLSQRRLAMTLMTLFAAIALLLSMIGLYGVMTFTVTQRTQEIGVRMALGAARKDMLRLVIGQGMWLAMIGIAIGIAAAIALTRFLSALLYEVSPRDPFTFIGGSILLTLVAFLACYLPARRATRIDPMVALRHE